MTSTTHVNAFWMAKPQYVVCRRGLIVRWSFCIENRWEVWGWAFTKWGAWRQALRVSGPPNRNH